MLSHQRRSKILAALSHANLIITPQSSLAKLTLTPNVMFSANSQPGSFSISAGPTKNSENYLMLRSIQLHPVVCAYPRLILSDHRNRPFMTQFARANGRLINGSSGYRKKVRRGVNESAICAQKCNDSIRWFMPFVCLLSPTFRPVTCSLYIIGAMIYEFVHASNGIIAQHHRQP